jgi:hypothetical protein
VVDGIEGTGGDVGFAVKVLLFRRCGGGAKESPPAHQLQFLF